MKLMFVISVIAAGLFACRTANEKPDIRPTEKFPPHDVCLYPASSSIKTLHYLASNGWLADAPDTANSTYRCWAEPRVVQLYGNGSDFVNVYYQASGFADGATTVLIVYSASGENVIENESTYRNVYVRFLDEMAHYALKQPLPDLAQREILNLHTYTSPENSNEESFPGRQGFILLSRTRSSDGKSIGVTAQIFSDNSLRLK